MAYLTLPWLSLDSHNWHITKRPGHKGCYHNQIPNTSSDFVPFTLQFWPCMAHVFVDLLCFLELQCHLRVTIWLYTYITDSHNGHSTFSKKKKKHNGHSSPAHKFGWHHIPAIWWLCYKLNHNLIGRNYQFRRIFFAFIALLSLLRCSECMRKGSISSLFDSKLKD